METVYEDVGELSSVFSSIYDSSSMDVWLLCVAQVESWQEC